MTEEELAQDAARRLGAAPTLDDVVGGILRGKMDRSDMVNCGGMPVVVESFDITRRHDDFRGSDTVVTLHLRVLNLHGLEKFR